MHAERKRNIMETHGAYIRIGKSKRCSSTHGWQAGTDSISVQKDSPLSHTYMHASRTCTTAERSYSSIRSKLSIISYILYKRRRRWRACIKARSNGIRRSRPAGRLAHPAASSSYRNRSKNFINLLLKNRISSCSLINIINCSCRRIHKCLVADN